MTAAFTVVVVATGEVIVVAGAVVVVAGAIVEVVVVGAGVPNFMITIPDPPIPP